MVGRFLTGAQDGYNEITTAGCCQYAGFFTVIGTFELVFRIEVTDYLYFVGVLTHFQFSICCLVRFYVEERYFGQDATVCHTGSGYHHIVTFVHRQRFLQHTAPGIANAHIYIAGTFEVQCLQLRIRKNLGNRKVAVIFRILQGLDRAVGSDHLTLFGCSLNGCFEVNVHPVAILHILYLTGYRFDTCRDTQATGNCDKEDIT